MESITQFAERANRLTNQGIEAGLVKPYESELIEKLRNFYYMGIPASILLSTREMCDGHCERRAMLISMGMEVFTLVFGNIKSLEVQFGIEGAEHWWVEKDEWVYDTSKGYKVKKELYYEIEQPVIKKVFSKQDCLAWPEYQEILTSDIEEDKSMTPFTLPILEHYVPTSFFPKWLEAEIKRFKQQIGYDALYQEVLDDMLAKGFKMTS